MSTYCLHPTNQVCDSCDFNTAAIRASDDGRELTYDELALILRMAIARTDYSHIASVLNEFGCNILTQQTYEGMVKSRITTGDYGLAAHAAHEAGRELTQEECDRVAHFALFINNDTAQVVQMVKIGKLSPVGIPALIDICLDRALPKIAGMLAEKIGHQFSAEEIERLHRSCEEKGCPDRLSDVYLLPTLSVA